MTERRIGRFITNTDYRVCGATAAEFVDFRFAMENILIESGPDCPKRFLGPNEPSLQGHQVEEVPGLVECIGMFRSLAEHGINDHKLDIEPMFPGAPLLVTVYKIDGATANGSTCYDHHFGMGRHKTAWPEDMPGLPEMEGDPRCASSSSSLAVARAALGDVQAIESL